MGGSNYRGAIPESVTFLGTDLGDLAEPVEIDLGFKEKDVRAVNKGDHIVTTLHTGSEPIIVVALYEWMIPAKFAKIFAGYGHASGTLEPGYNKGASAAICGSLVVKPAIAGMIQYTFPKAMVAVDKLQRISYGVDVSIIRVTFRALLDEASGNTYTSSVV